MLHARGKPNAVRGSIESMDGEAKTRLKYKFLLIHHPGSGHWIIRSGPPSNHFLFLRLLPLKPVFVFVFADIDTFFFLQSSIAAPKSNVSFLMAGKAHCMWCWQKKAYSLTSSALQAQVVAELRILFLYNKFGTEILRFPLSCLAFPSYLLCHLEVYFATLSELFSLFLAVCLVAFVVSGILLSPVGDFSSIQRVRV